TEQAAAKKFLPGQIEALVGGQRNADANQRDGTAEHLQMGQSGAKPEPFDGGGERGGEALNEQQAQAGAEPGQGLKQSRVAKTDADDAAEEENGKGVTGKSLTKRISPKTEKERGTRQTPEVCFRAANQIGGAVSTNDRDRKKDGR
ncbi:MAG: hypothetical protein JWQ71_1409, partial [Pedosphaera sp.]|nr:hypothetical protein [Pedosphaera sp.]